MNKVSYKVEAGKVVVDASVNYQMDNDKDGKPAVTASSVNHIEIDSYELGTELLKKDSAVLKLVLESMNYVPKAV